MKYPTPEAMFEKADEYFRARLNDMGEPIKDENGQVKYPITLTGMCNHLGILTETLDEYSKREEFTETVKGLKQRVESYYEGRLSYNNATGSIFALKTMGWKESASDVNHNHNITLIMALNDLARKPEAIEHVREMAAITA